MNSLCCHKFNVLVKGTFPKQQNVLERVCRILSPTVSSRLYSRDDDQEMGQKIQLTAYILDWEIVSASRGS